MTVDSNPTLLRELIEFTRDGEWGSDQPGHGRVAMLVVRGTDFDRFRFGDLNDIPIRYVEQRAAERKQLRVGDVLIETAGGTRGQPTGRSALVKQSHIERAGLPLTCASFARFLRLNNKKVEPSFVYWWLQHLHAAGEMEAHQVQHTGVARFQFTRFAESVAVPLPPLAEQRAIAHILGSLDDKIEVNRRMSETLEGIARAIFKSWFVDFDPVRAKMEGRDSDLAPEIAALFSDRLVETERGEVPHDWRLGPLASVTSELRRGISPTYVEQGGVRVLNQKCVRNRSVSFDASRRHDNNVRSVDGREIQNGDILVNSTGVGTLGRVGQVWALEEPTIVDSHVTVVRADCRHVSALFLGYDLTGREAEIEALGEGSTGQTELSRSRLGELLVLIPPREVLGAFDSFARPLTERRVLNLKQSETLAALRDLLLPKLMSGEIRVKDAEKLLGQAGV